MAQWTLAGKRALVTGGTKGIGRATAQAMLELDAEVCIAARSEVDVETAVAQWQAEGFKATGIAADVTCPEDRERILHMLQERWPCLDVLVNNAGMNLRKPFVEYAEAEIRSVLETNLFSAVLLTRLLFPLLRQGRGPSVVNVSSVAASVDVRSGAPYAMSKAAELQFTRSLAVEWAPEGIRVNAVSPWYTRTPLAAPVLQQPERLGAILHRTPLGRIAEPEEVAAVIAFLAMDKASYLTGQNLVIDGGLMAGAL